MPNLQQKHWKNLSGWSADPGQSIAGGFLKSFVIITFSDRWFRFLTAKIIGRSACKPLDNLSQKTVKLFPLTQTVVKKSLAIGFDGRDKVHSLTVLSFNCLERVNSPRLKPSRNTLLFHSPTAGKYFVSQQHSNIFNLPEEFLPCSVFNINAKQN